jgi:hypothetical protein
LAYRQSLDGGGTRHREGNWLPSPGKEILGGLESGAANRCNLFRRIRGADTGLDRFAVYKDGGCVTGVEENELCCMARRANYDVGVEMNVQETPKIQAFDARREFFLTVGCRSNPAEDQIAEEKPAKCH